MKGGFETILGKRSPRQMVRLVEGLGPVGEDSMLGHEASPLDRKIMAKKKSRRARTEASTRPCGMCPI